MENTAFILRLPGREIVLKSGDGDWEYDFCEDSDGVIYGRCVRQPFLRYIWDSDTSQVVRIVKFVPLLVPIAAGVRRLLSDKQ